MQNRVRSFGRDLTSAAGAQKRNEEVWVSKWPSLLLLPQVERPFSQFDKGKPVKSSLNISHLTITAEASWRICGLEPPLVSPPTWYLTVKTFLKYQRTFSSIFHLRLKFWTFGVALSWQDNLLPPVRQLLILENKSNSERELKSLLT